MNAPALIVAAVAAMSPTETRCQNAFYPYAVDGDTIIAPIDNGDSRVLRLRGVDAPERGERGYEAAREALRRKTDRKVLICVEAINDGGVIDYERGIYGRPLVVIRFEGRNLNRELIREGHAREWRAK